MRSKLLASIAHFLTSEVRDCSLEEEIGCEESTGEDGGVSTEYSREKYSRENATIKTTFELLLHLHTDSLGLHL